jgi:FtsP/CotA-like multicopper oxidase with cupredoxin domain
VQRSYDWIDGFNKSVIYINGQFPGPMIEANWGDTISVTVENLIETDIAEGLSLHWHGLRQANSQWADGVPGVSQCPIVPGKKFTYTFQADQYGTSWYHSHFSAQYNDGAYGPMVIHGPVQPEITYDFDLGPVMVSEHCHTSYYDELKLILQKPPVFPNVDNNLINGKGADNCNGTACQHGYGLSKFNFTSGKRHRLRLINTGQNANQKFSIDGHELTVIANDFVPVQPYSTTVVTLGVGQRTDVIVEGTGSPDNAVWMRAAIDMDCLNNTASIPTVRAAVYYENADTSQQPARNASGWPWQSNNCRNDPLNNTVPYYALTPPAQPATTKTIDISIGLNSSGNTLLFVDSSSFRINYNTPLYLLSRVGNTSYPDSPNLNTFNFGSNESVRLVISNTFEMQHPMHLHGHNYWVLAEGRGTWDGTVTNPSNPARRDTHILQPGTIENPSYLVLEWQQDNPGVWPLHCHMSNHVSAGLLLNVIVSPPPLSLCV